MKKIGSMTGRRLPEFPVAPDEGRPHPHTSVGIEVEAEGINYTDTRDYESKYWRVIQEGSLQGGIELVSEPVWGTAIPAALDDLVLFFDEHVPYMSFRCSTHIHLNVLDMYTAHLKRLMEGYLIYEVPIYRIHKEWNRYDNIFCIPARESVLLQKAYAQIIHGLDDDNLQGGGISNKYQGMNVNNLTGLGTLEFRHMGGMDNVVHLLQWIDILLRLKVSAQDETIDLLDPDAVWGPQRELLIIREDEVIEGSNIVDKLAMWRT